MSLSHASIEVALPLSERQAKHLDTEIRAASTVVVDNLRDLLNLLEQAAAGDIHVALGHTSLAAYLKSAVRIAPTDQADRKLLAVLMSERGLSLRAIESWQS